MFMLYEANCATCSIKFTQERVNCFGCDNLISECQLVDIRENRKGFGARPKRIIAHLKLTFMAERPPPPQIVQQELLMAAEEREDYF